MNLSARRGVRAAAALGAAATLVLTLVAPASAQASTGIPAATQVQAPTPDPLTNLAHLDFLLDEATPAEDVAGHTTYRLADEPTLVMPWTYADARPGGTFERVGGGGFNEETGYWNQGAYNADDIARAAVVYLRHWHQTGADSSRASAYEMLRSITYLQTTEGDNAGNVVLWMQPDGTLTPSAVPAELPDPSDSGPSYWLARTIWALGEGYAAFEDDDPAFAAFLEDRLALAIDAVERQVLVRYGEWAESDGMRVPAWLIVNGADASAEAVLGLAARVRAVPTDADATAALRQLAEGIAAMSAGGPGSWPYGAVLPWAESRSMWHAWGSQMPAALAEASVVLDDPSLAEPAVRDAAVFTPTLLTAGGPDNGWFPTPADRVQIAYGADARVQSLLAVADATGSRGFAQLAAMQAAWFFGANHAGAAMYDPATGIAFDGLQPNGDVNPNSGAESTIHALLTMLALDARPAVAARTLASTEVVDRDGLRVVEAESAVRTRGTVTAPTPWTGESLWSGGGLLLEAGDRAVFDIGRARTARTVEPVVWSAPGTASRSTWTADRGWIGRLAEDAPPQGISPVPGVLLPHELDRLVPANRRTVAVTVTRGSLELDALLIRPKVSRLVLGGETRTELVHSASAKPTSVRVGGDRSTTIRIYDVEGTLVREMPRRGAGTIVLPAGGFAIATG
ncbi:hypothetical protein [Microbacterium terricola]|uniref:Uncharacterized protein n=1 Tax=Microbacterium terricola TaxID=344163 RepID=A0ABM8DWA5_9MICO|nr:hypothetical protein [Microbacterium terricola]UYK39362.1 hypothetical protein OAU46_11715 [Microbacterium terricola]BDV29914.1 hypothetical protein Microterr_05740 [Microbacterium terricola]